MSFAAPRFNHGSDFNFLQSDAIGDGLSGPDVFVASDVSFLGFDAAAKAAVAAVVAPTTALYLQETGTTAPISVADLNQGQLGDCFLISSIGEMVLTSPNSISNMIKTNSNGTETVTLYANKNGSAVYSITSQLYAKQVSVDNHFSTASVNNGATQAALNGVKEIWPQVLEEAVANLGGGYGSIAYGGSPIIAMEELTGKAASYVSQSQISSVMTLAKLQSLVSANDMLVFDTTGGGSSAYNLVGNHAYMFEGIVGSGGSAAVKLGNPWGFDQPAMVPVSQLSKVFAEIDIGHV